MSYEVRPAQDGLWSVADDRDQIVFTGNWEQCEDWLDRQENARRDSTAAHRRSFLSSLLRRIFGWGADCVAWMIRQRTIAI